jgi:hypothetical protein
MGQAYSQVLQQVWPAAYDRINEGGTVSLKQVDYIIVPLDRLEAPAGASGAKVVVVYYCHRARADTLQASPPLVAKIGSSRKLKEEFDQANAWPTLPARTAARFARPIWYAGSIVREDPDVAVLLAPFSSEATPSLDGTRHSMRVRDLWRLLNDASEVLTGSCESLVRVEQHLGHVFDHMDILHRAGLARYQRRQVVFADEYDWYLRGTSPRTTSAQSRLPIIVNLFGNDPTVLRFGRTWPNPLHLINSLCSSGMGHDAYCGAIHGDLHPKNIVLGDGLESVIDLGWAQRSAHIIKDYVLLDINLRAITLPPCWTEWQIVEFTALLDPQDAIGDWPMPLERRANIIKQVIWGRAERAVRDWVWEYVVPYFLVAYGLLVFLDTARNQTALLASVLNAADRLTNLCPELRTT